MKLQYLFINLPRPIKRLLASGSDAILCLLTVYIAFYLKTGVFHLLHQGVIVAMATSVILAIPIFSGFGLYRAVFRYEGMSAIITIFEACFIYAVIYILIFSVYGVDKVPRNIGFIQPTLLFICVLISRFLARFLLSIDNPEIFKSSNLPKTVIYGAGDAGRQLMTALRASRRARIVAFIDDDPKLQGLIVDGINVLSPKKLENIILKNQIKTVLLAVPSATNSRKRQIIEELASYNVEVRTLPAFAEIAAGKISIAPLRDVKIEELLGRDPVKPVSQLMNKTILNKVVMVTGAGGSIGSELARQIIQIKPKTLLLVERAEFSLYSIYHELTESFDVSGIEIVPLLADVLDKNRIREIIQTWKVQTVYHAAAYKHVPMVEYNPLEGVKNNVFGTLNCALLAREYEVEEFVLISTDKAVRPTNVMGATKRLCELILQALATDPNKTVFTMVRFGNVLGSSGSVVPRFRKQIKEGGPITLTHKDIIRFFMTIPEASQLVIQAAALGKGGDVFLLDMGQPVKIFDLATRMIELSGYKVKDSNNPDGDIEIQITGLRPGEKLYEELLIKDNPMQTTHPKIFMAKETLMPINDLLEKLKELDVGLKNQNREDVLNIIKVCVPEYKSQGVIKDWVYQKECL